MSKETQVQCSDLNMDRECKRRSYSKQQHAIYLNREGNPSGTLEIATSEKEAQ
jgi:hypothetical protein